MYIALLKFKVSKPTTVTTPCAEVLLSLQVSSFTSNNSGPEETSTVLYGLSHEKVWHAQNIVWMWCCPPITGGWYSRMRKNVRKVQNWSKKKLMISVAFLLIFQVPLILKYSKICSNYIYFNLLSLHFRNLKFLNKWQNWLLSSLSSYHWKYLWVLCAKLWWASDEMCGLLQGLASNHHDVTADHIISLLAMRGDMNKRKVQQVAINFYHSCVAML